MRINSLNRISNNKKLKTNSVSIYFKNNKLTQMNAIIKVLKTLIMNYYLDLY